MAKITVDGRELVVEQATDADSPALAPARIIQLAGKKVAADNPLPISQGRSYV